MSSDGIITNEYVYDCEYIKADIAQQRKPNGDYTGCLALFVMQTENTGIVIWITKSGLVMDKNDVALTTSKVVYPTIWKILRTITRLT